MSDDWKLKKNVRPKVTEWAKYRSVKPQKSLQISLYWQMCWQGINKQLGFSSGSWCFNIPNVRPTTIGFMWSSHTSLPNLTKRSTDNLPNSESPSVELVKHPWDLKVVVYCFRMRGTHFYTSSSSSLLVSLDSGHWRPSCHQIPASLLRLSAISRDMCQTSTPHCASARTNRFG